MREDLLTSITSLVAERRFDHVLIESSGISEPLPVAETFTFKDKASGVQLSDVSRHLTPCGLYAFLVATSQPAVATLP